MNKTLIAAVTMTENHEPCLDIYDAETREVAEQFVARWNEQETSFAKSVGGYPGMAVIVEPNASSEPGLSDDLTAETYLYETA